MAFHTYCVVLVHAVAKLSAVCSMYALAWRIAKLRTSRRDHGLTIRLRKVYKLSPPRRGLS